MIVTHGVSRDVSTGAPTLSSVTVAQMKRKGKPETVSLTVNGPTRTYGQRTNPTPCAGSGAGATSGTEHMQEQKVELSRRPPCRNTPRGSSNVGGDKLPFVRYGPQHAPADALQGMSASAPLLLRPSAWPRVKSRVDTLWEPIDSWYLHYRIAL